MKRIGLISAAAIALFSGVASAADLPARTYTKAPPPALVAAYNWTGFYIGANAGYAWTNDVNTTADANAATLTPGQFPFSGPQMLTQLTGTLNATGFTGGIQAGYNHQFDKLVLGVEGDINYLDLHSSFSKMTAGSVPGGAGIFGTVDLKSQFMATVRGRVGLAFDRLMIYGTAGVAFTDFNTSFNGQICNGPGNCAIWAASNQPYNARLIYGGGAEYAFAGNWSFKVEYLHTDLGSQDITAVGVGPLIVQAPPCVNCTVTLHASPLRLDVVRAGINYKFGGPVVAKY